MKWKRITDFYVKAGPVDDLFEKWMKVAVLKDIPDKIVIAFALELRKATIVEEMPSVINIYMHDHRAGFPRDMPGPMICSIEYAKQPEEQTEERPDSSKTQQTNKTETPSEETIDAATKGDNKGEEGQRKGYGQCWECGEYGHPRRECKI